MSALREAELRRRTLDTEPPTPGSREGCGLQSAVRDRDVAVEQWVVGVAVLRDP
jgi:hypothetical protein